MRQLVKRRAPDRDAVHVACVAHVEIVVRAVLAGQFGDARDGLGSERVVRRLAPVAVRDASDAIRDVPLNLAPNLPD